MTALADQFPIARRWPPRDPAAIQYYGLPTPNGVKVSVMLEELGLPVMTTTIRASEAFKDASEQSVLVRDVKTNRLAPQCWADYVAVTEEIFTRMEGTP